MPPAVSAFSSATWDRPLLTTSVAERAAGHQKTPTVHRPDERVGGIHWSRSSRNSAEGPGCDEFEIKPSEFNRLVAPFDGFGGVQSLDLVATWWSRDSRILTNFLRMPSWFESCNHQIV